MTLPHREIGPPSTHGVSSGRRAVRGGRLRRSCQSPLLLSGVSVLLSPHPPLTRTCWAGVAVGLPSGGRGRPAEGSPQYLNISRIRPLLFRLWMYGGLRTECLFNQRGRPSSNASTSVYTFGSVCLVNVRLSWFLRSKEISVMCISQIRRVSPLESGFLRSQQARQFLRSVNRFKIPKRWLMEDRQEGVLVGDVTLILINQLQGPLLLLLCLFFK